MATNDSQPMYSLTEVARLLGVHRSTVSRFVATGQLKASRLGYRTVRISHEELMRFLASREISPTNQTRLAQTHE
jgi:excisionase family DNA binding protein